METNEEGCRHLSRGQQGKRVMETVSDKKWNASRGEVSAKALFENEDTVKGEIEKEK